MSNFEMLIGAMEESSVTREPVEITAQDVAAIEEGNAEYAEVATAIEEFDKLDAFAESLAEDAQIEKEMIDGNEEIGIGAAKKAVKSSNVVDSGMAKVLGVDMSTSGMEDFSDPKSVVIAASEEKMNVVKAMYLKAANFIAGLIRKVKAAAAKLYTSAFSKAKALKALEKQINKDNKVYNISKDNLEELFKKYSVVGMLSDSSSKFLEVTKMFIETKTNTENVLKKIDALKGASSKKLGTEFKNSGDKLNNLILDKVKDTKQKLFGDTFSDSADFGIISTTLNVVRVVVTEEDKVKVIKFTPKADDVEAPKNNGADIVGSDIVSNITTPAIKLSENVKALIEKSTKVAGDHQKEVSKLINDARKDDGLTDEVKAKINGSKVMASSALSAAMDAFKVSGQALDIAKKLSSTKKDEDKKDK